MPDQSAMQVCIDRSDITQLFAKFCHIIDDLSFERLGEVFTEDAVFDYRSLGETVKGQSTLHYGLNGFKAFLRGTMSDVGPGLTRFMTNLVIEVRGDEAEIVNHSTVLNLPQGGYYKSHAVRTTAGWRIDESIFIWRDYKPLAVKMGFDFSLLKAAAND